MCDARVQALGPPGAPYRPPLTIAGQQPAPLAWRLADVSPQGLDCSPDFVVERHDTLLTLHNGAVLADALFLIGQARVKLGSGDQASGDEDLSAAAELVPADTIEAITHMIDVGTLPEPGPGPEAMAAWLEACRMAGAGEWTLTRILFPSAAELAWEEHEAFLSRLDEMVADADRRRAVGEVTWFPELPPERPPPWEDDSAVTGMARPGALSESLRKMGLM